ncbi:hypothetical protein RP20_CCG010355 [Aedes albopictus]|nr:uncharacterized protein LOC115264791 [Aedes albopictus]KXJ76074.1 hypothetical protein RP20_CCG010355 [Aedes albopictus]
MADSTPPVAGGMEGIEYSIIEQVEVLPNMFSIVADPSNAVASADPVATQLISDMDEQDEDNEINDDNEISDAERSVEPAPSIIVVTTHANGNVQNNVQDENESPNRPTKRAPNPGYQMTNKKHATSTMKFHAFQVNWSKISDTLLKRITSLQEYRLEHPHSAVPRLIRLKKTEMCTLINSVVDQLRIIDSDISAAVMETVARQMLTKYPCLEVLDDDGFSNGLSHMTMKHKMINRNTYLNRTDLSSSEAPTLAPKAKFRRAGTVREYWKATTDMCSKEVFSKLRRDEPVLLTDDFLEESQGYVRSRIDQKKELSSILSELPVLRRRTLLNYHFKKATGIDICTLRTYFCAKKAKIVEFSSSQRKLKLSDSASDYDVFNFLARSVGESLGDLVLKKEIGTRIDEVRDDSAGPVLICIDLGNDVGMHYVFAENTRLSEGTTDIVCAIQDLMTVQYVHSFMYLKGTAKFLELVQQYFLKIFPTKGSKSNAVRIGQQQRTVQKVIAALSDYAPEQEQE